EPRLLRRLLGAAAVTLEFPSVIEASQRVALDPGAGKLRAAMRAARLGQVNRSALATIERERLPHDAQRHRSADLQIRGVIDRIPEASQVGARDRIGTGEDEIVALRRQTPGLLNG